MVYKEDLASSVEEALRPLRKNPEDIETKRKRIGTQVPQVSRVGALKKKGLVGTWRLNLSCPASGCDYCNN